MFAKLKLNSSFRVQQVLSPATVVFLPAKFYQVDVRVIPVWGLYANMIAQVLSQIVSHICIYYHRNVVTAAEVETGETLFVSSDLSDIKVEMAKWESIESGASADPAAKKGIHHGHRSQP